MPVNGTRLDHVINQAQKSFISLWIDLIDSECEVPSFETNCLHRRSITSSQSDRFQTVEKANEKNRERHTHTHTQKERERERGAVTVRNSHLTSESKTKTYHRYNIENQNERNLLAKCKAVYGAWVYFEVQINERRQ